MESRAQPTGSVSCALSLILQQAYLVLWQFQARENVTLLLRLIPIQSRMPRTDSIFPIFNPGA